MSGAHGGPYAVNRWLRGRERLDRLVSVLLLALASPLVGAAMVAVLVFDRQNPFIVVTRVGREGHPFNMVKLRSMRTGTSGPAITQPGDSRVTRVGKIIRALHLDEVPQLLAVVSGHMSLVGPRPEDPKFVFDDQKRWTTVLEAAPGIAGITQIMTGDAELEVLGAHPDDVEGTYRRQVVPVKLDLDGWYVKNASPLVDGLVVIGLVQRVLLGRSSTSVHRYVRRRLARDQVEMLDELGVVA